MPRSVFARNATAAKGKKRNPLELSESQFQSQVLQFARLHGWTVYHVPDSRRVTACGFPDLVMMHPGRPNPLIAAELKRDGQKPRADQVAWMQAFRLAGVPCYLWTPSGWAEVVAVLNGTTQQGA